VGSLVVVKQLAISVGLYKPARALHRALHFSERRHFRAHQLLLGHFVKAGDLVFDVGANIGNRTEMLLSLGASVVAFEPQPICAREIVARGNYRLKVVQKAVGSTEGTAQFYLKVATVHASLMPDWLGADHTGVITVSVTTLDKAIEEFGLPAFCMIDVEGFEVEVLRGLSRRIPAISLEYHCDEHGIERVKRCLELLSTLGIYSVNLTGQEDAKFLSLNWLTVPEFLKSFPDCANGNRWGDLFVRVCPGSSGRIAELSEHEAD
jgi:FkbM family methyltransferase